MSWIKLESFACDHSGQILIYWKGGGGGVLQVVLNVQRSRSFNSVLRKKSIPPASNENVDFKFSAYVAFQVHDKKIGKPNNQKSLGVSNPRGRNRISTVG